MYETTRFQTVIISVNICKYGDIKRSIEVKKKERVRKEKTKPERARERKRVIVCVCEREREIEGEREAARVIFPGLLFVLFLLRLRWSIQSRAPKRNQTCRN
jgi:hypothetical protein